MANQKSGLPFLYDDNGKMVGVRHQDNSESAVVLGDRNPFTGGIKKMSAGDRFGAGAKIVPWDTTSPELQAAHDAAITEGMALDLGGGTYTITDPVTIRSAALSVYADGATIDCTGMTGPHAIQCDAVSADASYGGKSYALHGLTLVGPGKGEAGTIGILVAGSAASRSPRPSFFGGHVTGFETGVKFGAYAYLAQFYSFDIFSTALAIHQAVGSDAGENIGWFGCGIYNSDQALLFQDDTSEHFFYGTSIDYVKRLGVIEKGRAHLLGSRIECDGALIDSTDFCVLSGDATNLTMQAGYFVLNTATSAGPYSYEHLFNLSHANAHVHLIGVQMQNLRNDDQRLAVGVGAGNLHVRDTIMFGTTSLMPSRTAAEASLLIDGDAEDATVTDHWQLYADTAALADRLAGTNITVGKSSASAVSGSQSISLTKSGGAGTAAVAELLVPVDKSRRLSGQFQWRAAGVTGSVTVRYRWGKRVGTDPASGVVEVHDRGSDLGAVTLTPGSSDWATVNMYPTQTAPEWADCLRVQFVMGSMGAGALLIDDIAFCPW